MNFGKWAGTPLKQVEHDYFEWICKQDFSEEFKQLCREARRGIFPEKGLF